MSVKKGRFYFKLTSNGNLLGEYSNEFLDHSGTESAVRDHDDEIDEKLPAYAGSYHSCWLDDTEPNYAKLVITPLYKPQSNIYELKWTSGPENTTVYEGEGMLCDDILIGFYK